MVISAGALNRRIQFHRRSPLPQAVHTLRGGLVSFGAMQWGSFKSGPPQDLRIGGFQLVADAGTMMVRESDFTRGVTTSHLAEMEGAYWEVRAIQSAERKDGGIRLLVRRAPDRPMYERAFETEGEAVTLRAVSMRPNNQPAGNTEVVARALVRGYQPEELTGGIVQADRRILLAADDLTGFPGGVQVGDLITVRNRTMRIGAVDDSTHRFAGTLNAFEILAKG